MEKMRNESQEAIKITEIIENFNEMSNMNNSDNQEIESATEKKQQKLSLAMAYVPWQKFENLYNSTMALNRGTLFKDLDFPFIREEVIPRER